MDPLSLVASAAAQNNSWSAQQAQKQMDFQERMSNTAHQREIADLQASGLNPVLSSKLGGASVPNGAMGTVDTSLTSALVEALKEFGEGMMSSAVHAAASSGRNPVLTHDILGDPSSASDVLATLGSYGDKDKFKNQGLQAYQFYGQQMKAQVVDLAYAVGGNRAKELAKRVVNGPFGQAITAIGDLISARAIWKDASATHNTKTIMGRPAVKTVEGPYVIATPGQVKRYFK